MRIGSLSCSYCSFFNFRNSDHSHYIHDFLTKDNPISSNGYAEEITKLVKELKLEVPMTPGPGPDDMRDMAKHLNMTQEKLRTTILTEIAQNSTPNPPPSATPLIARDLTDRFDNTTKGLSDSTRDSRGL